MQGVHADRYEKGTVLEHLREMKAEEFDVGKQDLRILRGFGVTIQTPPWSTVARIKGAGGISPGDSYAGALAIEEEGSLVVGADPEFGDLLDDIDVQHIRKDPA